MKKILAIILGAILLTSCVSQHFNGFRTGAITNNTDHSVSSEYSLCRGVATYSFSVRENRFINCVIKTKAGEINFSISPIGEDALFARSLTEDGEYNVDLPKAGKYKIVVNTNSHSGSYYFNWGNVGNN